MRFSDDARIRFSEFVEGLTRSGARSWEFSSLSPGDFEAQIGKAADATPAGPCGRHITLDGQDYPCTLENCNRVDHQGAFSWTEDR